MGTLWRSGLIESGPVICPFRLLTGKPCPFCGSTRALGALSGGDLVAAWQNNPLTVTLVPLAVLVLVQPQLATRFSAWFAGQFSKRSRLEVVTVIGVLLVLIWTWNIATRW